MELTKSKIDQAIEILNEEDIDLWLLFCRETPMMADPVLPLVVGADVVWQSAFFIPRNGETLALVGSFDAANFQKSGHFRTVKTYIEDCGGEIKKILSTLDPGRIALNYSPNDVAADGLTHGMYLLLTEYLQDSPFVERFTSAEKIIAKLRGRKTELELARVRQAAEMAVQCWEQSLAEIRSGMSEIQIARLLVRKIEALGGTPSFPPLVNAGSKSSAGHGLPTAAVLEPGDLLHLDFGVRFEGYCSDIQRLAYCKKEEQVPAELIAAFDMVKEVIQETAKLYKPGALGYAIDEVARQMLTQAGYAPYDHALGHQIGRSVHDGAAIVGPRWKRYGNTPLIPLEGYNTFTVELGINLPGTGYVGLEEDLVIRQDGGHFLHPRQTELAFIP